MQLNFCTWNISFGNQIEILSRNFAKNDFKKLDIIALQESSIHGGLEDTKRLAGVLGADFRSYQVRAQISKGKEQANGFIWNKKNIEVTGTSTVILPDYKSAKLKKTEYALKHVLPKESRNCVILEGKKKDKTIRIYNTHFDMIGFGLKTKQLLAIMDIDVLKKPADLVLITGDFNTFRVLKYPKWKKFNEEANKLGFFDITEHIEWTFHKKLVRFRQKLDIIFLKKKRGIKQKTDVKFFSGSDHFPVFSILRLA